MSNNVKISQLIRKSLSQVQDEGILPVSVPLDDTYGVPVKDITDLIGSGGGGAGVVTSVINFNRFGSTFSQNSTYSVTLTSGDYPAGFTPTAMSGVVIGGVINPPTVLRDMAWHFWMHNNNGAITLYIRWLTTWVEITSNAQIILKWI